MPPSINPAPSRKVVLNESDTTLHDVLVPLAHIYAMGGYKGIANREINEGHLKYLTANFNVDLFQNPLLYRPKLSDPDTNYIVGGHHRTTVIRSKAQLQGISEWDGLLRCDVLTPDSVRASGMSEVDYLLYMMVQDNRQRAHRLAEGFQNGQMTSPWAHAFAPHRFTPAFDSMKKYALTYSSIMRAYCTARDYYRDIAAGMPAVTLASRLKVQELSEGHLHEFQNPGNPLEMLTAVDALVTWAREVADPLGVPGVRNKRHNLYTARVLTFVMLTHLDPENRHHRPQALTEIPAQFRRPGNPFMGFPKNVKVKETEPDLNTIVNTLLGYVNHGRYAKNRLTVLGGMPSVL